MFRKLSSLTFCIILISLTTTIFASDYKQKHLIFKVDFGKILVVSNDNTATIFAKEMKANGWSILPVLGDLSKVPVLYVYEDGRRGFGNWEMDTETRRAFNKEADGVFQKI